MKLTLYFCDRRKEKLALADKEKDKKIESLQVVLIMPK